MSVLESLDRNAIEGLAEVAGRLKHDLGKYVAFQYRWLPESASDVDRRDALASDLLATRRGPSATRDACEVWAEFAPILMGRAAVPGNGTVDLSVDPGVAAIADAMAVIAEIIELLRSNSETPADLVRGADAARVVADSCRDLLRRIRSHL